MKNVSKEEVKNLIANFPIKPRFNKVIITLNSINEEGRVKTSNNVLSDVQYVIAKGNMVLDINEGDQVIIDLEKLTKPVRLDVNNNVETVYEANIDAIEVNGNTYAFIEDRIIKAIDERTENKIKL